MGPRAPSSGVTLQAGWPGRSRRWQIETQASLMEPLWVEFATLIGSGDRPEFSPTHPWGCHRRRIPDRVVFDHVIAALVHGSGYERLAGPRCSDRTIRRRLRDWAEAGHGPALLRIGLAAY